MSESKTEYDSSNLDVDYINDEEAINQYNKDKEQPLTTRKLSDEDSEKETSDSNESEEKEESENSEDSEESTESNILKQINNDFFTTTNMFLLLWFLVIYIIVYYILGMFFNKGSQPGDFQKSLGRTLDLIFFISVFVFIISYYYSTPQEQTIKDIETLYKKLLVFLEKPSSAVSSLLFIITFYIIVYLFQIPMSSGSKPFFIGILEGSAWVTLIVSILVSSIKQIWDINILDFFKSETPKESEVEDKETPIPVITDEVFNISGNKYTYEDAQAICKSYGAKLATYDQIEDAYNNGAEWCNYGWSENQMAFFPTQKNTWDELQKNPKKKNNCGRPGVNGGYIQNPYIKFGVNCYGKKPTPSAKEEQRFQQNQSNIPLTVEDKKLQEKSDYWKKNSDKLEINSFNSQNWSRY